MVRHDALGRPVEVTMPDGTRVRPTYNEAGLLEILTGNVRGATTTRLVDRVDYDAKGRRRLIVYPNGARTTSSYEHDTFRLAHQRTSRGTEILQDLRYTYDPIGNVTHVEDNAQATVFFANQVVGASSDFSYDATYRLIEATGREHLGQAGTDAFPAGPVAQPADGKAMGRYTERYRYDEVGNILELSHSSLNPTTAAWARSYNYNEQSLLEHRDGNRVTTTVVGTGPPDAFSYDAHGNVTSMSHLPLMRWDHRDRLISTSQQRVTGGIVPETTYYVYDAGGRRVRKVTERQAGAGATPTRSHETIYVDGVELHREYDGTGTKVMLERQTVHIADDTQTVALVETRTVGVDRGAPDLTRFQITNHLGSSTLELDGSGSGRVISYEEYLPYGDTSFQALGRLTETPKRYRFTGKERDEESGFYYFGARYYGAVARSMDQLRSGWRRRRPDVVRVHLVTAWLPGSNGASGRACAGGGRPGSRQCSRAAATVLRIHRGTKDSPYR